MDNIKKWVCVKGRIISIFHQILRQIYIFFSHDKKEGVPKGTLFFLSCKFKAGTPLSQGWCGGGEIFLEKTSKLPKVAQKGSCKAVKGRFRGCGASSESSSGG